MRAVSPDQFNSRVPSAQPQDVLPCGTGIASYEGGIRALFEENADAEVAKCHEKCGLFCPNASDRTFRTGGSHAREEAIMRGALKAPFGMIVTGPTGSGKTTTLVASLSVINELSRNILTVADPTEYQITGVSQTQLRARERPDFRHSTALILASRS
jgi:hypothetical protein